MEKRNIIHYTLYLHSYNNNNNNANLQYKLPGLKLGNPLEQAIAPGLLEPIQKNSFSNWYYRESNPEHPHQALQY